MSGIQHIKKEDLHLLNRIGSGRFSTVFKARLHSQEVAAKRLHEPDNHEVEVLATLDHPHIVKLIGTAQDNLDFYLVLELCKGGSLRQYLDQKRAENKLLSIDLIHDWALQAVRPIHYLRGRNFIHKDIKSPNYLIADGNVLKLADFGITKINIESTIQNATHSGSPAWGAPELFKHDILSPSYDISAYGVIVWELCTTLVPFEGSSADHIIWRICKNNERPPIPAHCPKPLDDLMRKCWEVDWKKRPSAEEILQLLLPLSIAEKKAFIAGPWKCEKVFAHQKSGWQGYGGIAINPTNQDVAVMDMYEGKLVVYHSTGEFKFSISLNRGPYIVWLWHVVVSNEGHYYTTDATQFVSCYKKSGTRTGKWVAASPDHAPSNATISGLAIDHKSNLLLVGVVYQKYISKHRLDGTHVNSIKVNIEPYFLSVTSQGTIVISGSLNVQEVDQTGQLLHTLTPPSHQVKYWTPCGVYCHNGIIFMCNFHTNQVVCFSIHGDYMGYIPVDVIPRFLTFVPGQKKFLVTSPGKVMMYSCSQ